jgi:hypothetical protein
MALVLDKKKSKSGYGCEYGVPVRACVKNKNNWLSAA